MKQDYTVFVRKVDRRTKSGFRAISTKVVVDMSKSEIETRATLLRKLYATMPGVYEVTYAPARMTVKSLMTGQDVQIDADTPWCCNPASETFWSM